MTFMDLTGPVSTFHNPARNYHQKKVSNLQCQNLTNNYYYHPDSYQMNHGKIILKNVGIGHKKKIMFD